MKATLQFRLIAMVLTSAAGWWEGEGDGVRKSGSEAG
jgi:hypothetical protein